jgi:preprotein translocase subunit SecD
MTRNTTNRILIILIILGFALWIDFSNEIKLTNPRDGSAIFEVDTSPRLGLDLRGGLQVLLEADLPETTNIEAAEMETARNIVENRTNALGVSENLIQIAGERRIVGEFPGVKDANAILDTIQQTGLLEFVDTGDTPLEPGTIIETDYGLESLTASPTAAEGETSTVFHTVMTGKDLRSVSVTPSQFGTDYSIDFTLTDEGRELFGAHTAANIGKFLTIVLDKQVISSPQINDAITEGLGTISGSFTPEEANALAVQLKYGSLPIPLKVVETRIIGPTLGEESLQKSLIAGLIGFIIVMLFMGIYYRLPGMVADVSLIIYAIILFAVFKMIGVTLTLPGIAGIMLSTGSALDANILVFERFKEELRSGRSMGQAFDQAWSRAWPSIRDSNIAALITATILFWFGSSFGATIVKGFSLTLAIGVLVSLFSSQFITRSLLGLALQTFKLKNLERWVGI